MTTEPELKVAAQNYVRQIRAARDAADVARDAADKMENDLNAMLLPSMRAYITVVWNEIWARLVWSVKADSMSADDTGIHIVAYHRGGDEETVLPWAFLEDPEKWVMEHQVEQTAQTVFSAAQIEAAEKTRLAELVAKYPDVAASLAAEHTGAI